MLIDKSSLCMYSRSSGFHRQKGVALIAFMLVFVVGSSYALVSKLNANVRQSVRDQGTYKSLQMAKWALIGYAVSYPDVIDAASGPGYLLCPDRDNDGATDPGACSLSGQTSIGRFPYKTLEMEELRDSSGATLWYAVADNYRNNPKTIPLNSETPGNFTLDGAGDIVAVIFAPGNPVGTQDRTADPDDVDNYLEDDNATELPSGLYDNDFVTTSAGEFNDRLITITRAELMYYVEKRVIGEFANLLDKYRTDYGAYPWLAPFANPRSGGPQITGTVTTSSGTNLIDSGAGFVTDGILPGDLVYNSTDGSRGQVESVDSETQLTLVSLEFGSENDFDSGDNYEIPRFNGTVDTRNGFLPYHEASELFSTSFSPDWEVTEANNAHIKVDGSTPASYEAGIKSSVGTSIETTTGTITVPESDGSCLWSSETAASCKGGYTDRNFLSGTATHDGNLTLIDCNKNFYNAGTRRGDLAVNYDDLSANLIDSTAEAGSDGTTLVDTSVDFVASGIEPRYYLVTNTTDNDALAIVQTVAVNTLEVIALPDENFVMDQGDEYTVREIRQAIVDGFTIVSVDCDGDGNNESVRSVTTYSQDTGSPVTFNANDRYRVILASNNGSNAADAGTDIAAFKLVETAVSDFATYGIEVGDVVENVTFGGIGVITSLGTETGNAVAYYTALQGGTYQDIYQGETYRIHYKYVDRRQYDFEYDFTGTSAVSTPSTDGSKRRTVCTGFGTGCTDETPTATGMSENTDPPTVTITDYDDNSTMLAQASVDIHSDTLGALRVADIQYDPVVGDDINSWVVDNEWHHLIYVAMSANDIPGATGTCTAGTTCLSLSGPFTLSNDVQSLVISAGQELAGQDRNLGNIDDYLENENFDQDDDYQEDELDADFNDQVLVLLPEESY